MLNISHFIINTMNQPEIIHSAKLVPDMKFFFIGNYKRSNCSNTGTGYIYKFTICWFFEIS
jgi:hypothetical protein